MANPPNFMEELAHHLCTTSEQPLRDAATFTHQPLTRPIVRSLC